MYWLPYMVWADWLNSRTRPLSSGSTRHVILLEDEDDKDAREAAANAVLKSCGLNIRQQPMGLPGPPVFVESLSPRVRSI